MYYKCTQRIIFFFSLHLSILRQEFKAIAVKLLLFKNLLVFHKKKQTYPKNLIYRKFNLFDYLQNFGFFCLIEKINLKNNLTLKLNN